MTYDETNYQNLYKSCLLLLAFIEVALRIQFLFKYETFSWSILKRKMTENSEINLVETF